MEVNVRVKARLCAGPGEDSARKAIDDVDALADLHSVAVVVVSLNFRRHFRLTGCVSCSGLEDTHDIG
jgi:hypothetical protein